MNGLIVSHLESDPHTSGQVPGVCPQSLHVTLQLAVHHHNFGQLSEAAKLYCEVLHADPGQAAASHNLGVLLLQMGLPEAGLPHLEAALARKPESQRYWLSYIDALDQAGQTERAQRMLAFGQQHGLDGDEMEVLADMLATGLKNGQTPIRCSVSRRRRAKRHGFRCTKRGAGDL